MGFDIKGTIKSPEITGEAKLENGDYENNIIGTIIKDINADISAESNRFILNKISGTDGDKGKIYGNGWLDLSLSKKFPYNISLNLKNMAIIRSNTTTMTISGTPTISGNLNDHTISGKLSIDKGEYRISERLPAEITDLEVTEINRQEPEHNKEQKETIKKSVINFDMSVESTGKVYFTGSALNSEWKGDLLIKGTTSKPSIVGRLEILRGNYSLLGRRFDLTEGRVDLDGTYPMSPYLDITGEAKTSDITANIRLIGDLKDLKITLSSVPSLPSDEIISLLLFGKEASQITPLQAIELGAAANTMIGKGGGYDIIGSTKKIIGVDQLEVNQSEEKIEESTLSVGKYVRDDLYIEAEKGLGAQSGKASVTWEVTPNITVDTEIREDYSTGFGVNWKWDY
jgi:translocation and assembly module TamB